MYYYRLGTKKNCCKKVIKSTLNRSGINNRSYSITHNSNNEHMHLLGSTDVEGGLQNRTLPPDSCLNPTEEPDLPSAR